MIRLALCCLFTKEPIKFRTTTVRYLSTLEKKSIDHLEYIDELICANLSALSKAITFCGKNRIGSFRINSDFFPIYTHPEYGYDLKDLPSYQQILLECSDLKDKAVNFGVRLTFHPDQFVVLNSLRRDVVENSIKELSYHGVLSELVGADVINIHGGGGYGNKAEAILRFKTHFKYLPTSVQQRLTVENDDRVFTPEELIPLCHQLNIPFVYDVHHHRCLKDQLSIKEATQMALATWNEREPLFHISSPKCGWEGPPAKIRQHHDFIDINDFPEEWKAISQQITIDIEAKAKECAVLDIYKKMEINRWKMAPICIKN